VWKTWTENYGDSKVEVKKTFMNALIAMKRGKMNHKRKKTTTQCDKHNISIRENEI
jgi:hypothetical protein